MNKHTPGPWIEASGSILPADTTPQNPRRAIAVVNTDYPEYVGNCALLSAAPELLEALKTLVNLHHDWDKGSAYVTVAFHEKNKAAIASARAAIAKAIGASNG